MRRLFSCVCRNFFLVTGLGAKERSLIDLLRKLAFSENLVGVTSFLFMALLLRRVGNACGATKLNTEPPFIVISFYSLTSPASTSPTPSALSDRLSTLLGFFHFVLDLHFDFCVELIFFIRVRLSVPCPPLSSYFPSYFPCWQAPYV